MIIGFLIDTFPSVSETFILNQITGLMDLGHDVRILIGARPTETVVHPQVVEYQLLSKVICYNDKPKNFWIRLGVALVRLPCALAYNPKMIFRALNFFRYGREAASLNLFFQCWHLLSAGPIDILQCHFASNGLIAARFSELGYPAKTVTMLHGYDLRQAESGMNDLTPIFRNSHVVLSISAFSRQMLTRLGCPPEKIKYHPVGVDLNSFNPRHVRKENPQPARIQILTVARLHDVKNISYAIDIIKQLIQLSESARYQWHYQIIGDGPLREMLIRKIRQDGLETVVELCGAQDQNFVRDALENTDIFLMTSLAEILPVSIMEAQAMKVPVVSTAVGAVAEIISDGLTGILIPPDQPDVAAQKIFTVIVDEEKRATMGNAARQSVEEKFDIRKLNEKLAALYKQILA